MIRLFGSECVSHGGGVGDLDKVSVAQIAMAGTNTARTARRTLEY